MSDESPINWDEDPVTVEVNAEAYTDEIAAAFVEVEDAMLDLDDAVVALKETTAVEVEIGDNTREVLVGDALEINVSVDFETDKATHEGIAEALESHGL